MIRELMADIGKWYEAHAPEAARPIYNPPATSDQIERYSQVTGLSLPVELGDLYRFANGMKAGDFTTHGRLHSLQEVEDVWRYNLRLCSMGKVEFPRSETAGIVKAVYWSRGWIPLTDIGNTDTLAMDLDPDVNGVSGQVFYYEKCQCAIEVLGSSLSEYLARFRDGLSKGDYVWDSKYGYVIAKAEMR